MTPDKKALLRVPSSSAVLTCAMVFLLRRTLPTSSYLYAITKFCTSFLYPLYYRPFCALLDSASIVACQSKILKFPHASYTCPSPSSHNNRAFFYFFQPRIGSPFPFFSYGGSGRAQSPPGSNFFNLEFARWLLSDGHCALPLLLVLVPRQ